MEILRSEHKPREVNVVVGQESWEEDSSVNVEGYKWFGKHSYIPGVCRGGVGRWPCLGGRSCSSMKLHPRACLWLRGKANKGSPLGEGET